MDDKYVRDDDPDVARADADLRDDTEPATSHDVVEGGAIGVVGGAIVGGLAGGPLGAVIGAVAGGVASAAGVAAVDRHDHDYQRTVDGPVDDTVPYNDGAPVATQGAYGAQPVVSQGIYTDPVVPSAASYAGASVPVDNPEISGTFSGGGAAAYDDYSGDYRNHFQTVYGASNASYGEYDPAYRYGADLAGDSRFHTGEWDSVERFARPDWEARHEGTWDRFKDSVRYGWDRAKAKATGHPAGIDNDANAGFRHDDLDADEVDVDENRPATIG